MNGKIPEHRLTDRDGDVLNMARLDEGVYATAQMGNGSSITTVGPFTPEQLRAALDEVAPAGSYTRTDEEDRQARALTPDAVDGDMVNRALSKARSLDVRLGIASMRHILIAALTEPPTRPEGAEAVSSVLGALREDEGQWMTYASDKDLDGLADALAKRGVRVTGAES